MNALIIAAHGSRRKESALEVAALCEKLAQKAKDPLAEISFDKVVPAFLQFAVPLLEQTIEDLVQEGAREIVVFPFFIAAGSHLLTDIPQAVEKAARAHPNVAFSITGHLGGIDTIDEIILREVATHLNRQA